MRYLIILGLGLSTIAGTYFLGYKAAQSACAARIATIQADLVETQLEHKNALERHVEALRGLRRFNQKKLEAQRAELIGNQNAKIITECNIDPLDLDNIRLQFDRVSSFANTPDAAE